MPGARPDRANICEFVDDVVDELGSREEINYIRREYSRTAPAPTASCACLQETGDLKKVVDYIIEETEDGLFDDRRQAECSASVNQAAERHRRSIRS